MAALHATASLRRARRSEDQIRPGETQRVAPRSNAGGPTRAVQHRIEPKPTQVGKAIITTNTLTTTSSDNRNAPCSPHSMTTAHTSSLSVDDILSDLAALSGTPSYDEGKDDYATSTTARHPLLSLGRSLAPSESLSTSERQGGGNEDANDGDENADHAAAAALAAALLADGDGRGISSAKSDSAAMPPLALLSRYLAASETISQLNHAGDNTRVDALYERIAQLHVKLEGVERGVQGALDQVQRGGSSGGDDGSV